MTTIIKSNTVSKNTLGDIHGVVGNTDWSMMLDFANDKYIKNGVEVTISDALTTDRNVEELVFDEEGIPSLIGKNVPRISYNYAQDTRGLVVESDYVTYIIPSGNPAPTTVSLDSAVYTAQIEGTGSVDISSAALSHKLGLGTQDNPLTFRHPVKGDVIITYTGEVKRVAITSVTTKTGYKSTKKYAEMYRGRGEKDIYKVDVSSAITGTNWTVLFACRLNEVIREGFEISNAQELLSLVEIGSPSKYFALHRVLNTDTVAQSLFARLYDGTLKGLDGLMGMSEEYVVIAVTCSSEGFLLSCNGYTTTPIKYMDAFKPASITIGYSTQYRFSAEATFNKFATYNYAMTSEQLSELTKKSF